MRTTRAGAAAEPRLSLAIIAAVAGLLSGLCLALALIVGGATVLRSLNLNQPWEQALGFGAAVGAGALVGASLWWRIVVVPGRLTLARGALVGLLAGVLVHPVAWLFTFTPLTLTFALTGHAPVAATAQALADSLPVSFILAALSLVAFGWLTAVVGTVSGGLLALALGRRRPSAGPGVRLA